MLDFVIDVFVILMLLLILFSATIGMCFRIIRNIAKPK